MGSFSQFMGKRWSQTIGDLVTQSQTDFANVTRIVEKLSKNGYIIKRKNHKDGRSVLLYCTDKVKTIMPHINKCQMLSLNISLKGISQEEQDTFLHILDKIEKNCINYLNSTK